ncbi:hypothetical protein V8B55DRAFT_1325592 [Mucor lusitanicus]|uniref:Uncharacterized protein n=2 Tax=Mucor circinelloides f. lusitanicus TaxID=29924 RepID=A0A168PID4_MUCCL|nr:hypothetical protein FB192DRAFT_1471536 [Mucor lusitanicus]OAD07778.1 hypothetical protein MUCCIDRAFT_104719 [Mucor lusitanicus CBS 277.49]
MSIWPRPHPSEQPSLFVGPVYALTPSATKTIRVNTLSCPLPPKFDINKDLPTSQQEQLAEVLTRYLSVFATSLKEVGRLNVEPYEIKVKDGAVPVKVPPRIIPHAANEWFKGYIEQLLELGLIEPCTGSWAAAVVLVPSNAEDRAPRKRRVREIKLAPKIKMNANGKVLTVYTMRLEEAGEDIAAEESSSSYEMLMRQWAEGDVANQSYRVKNVDGYKQEVTSESPTIEADKKDPYRVYVSCKTVNKVMVDSGYPIPNINFPFTLLKDAKYFALYDCLKGF